MDGPGAAGGVGGAGAQVVHAYDVIQDLQVAVSVGWSAGPGDALPSFLDVLEQEAEGRRHRRINRLGKESRLPSGRTWETWGHDRMPPALRQQLDQPGQLRGSGRQRPGLRSCRDRKDPGSLRLSLPAGAGAPRGQARR